GTELGTFSGSGSLAMALALPEDGRIVACDVNAEWTAIGRKHWQQGGVAHKIDLRRAPAGVTLLRKGGLSVRDNMLWSGVVADPDKHDKDTDALRALNLKIKDDNRVDFCLRSSDER